MTIRLELTLNAVGAGFILSCENVGGDYVRLWAQDNSWGWSMPRVLVRTEADGDVTATLRPRDAVFTANLPNYATLAPGEGTAYSVGADGLDLAAFQPLLPFTESPLWVQGELSVTPSPEAAEFGVWCGSLRSEVTRLLPPHLWLRPASDVP